MKKIILLIMLFYFTTGAFSQQVLPPKKKLSAEEYRRKSNNQIVLGSILLAGGTGLAFVGVNTRKNVSDLNDIMGFIVEPVGIIAASASIPLFIGAIHNYKRAKMLSGNVKLEHSYVPRFVAAARYSFPAISIKINLGSLPAGRNIPRASRDLRM